MSHSRSSSLYDPKILLPAIGSAFVKLDPRALARNPVMFVVAAVSLLVTVLFLRDIALGNGGLVFSCQIILWLWFTVLFANFAEAMAEARGKAHADTLRKTKTDAPARRLTSSGKTEQVSASALRAGDVVVVAHLAAELDQFRRVVDDLAHLRTQLRRRA